MEALNRDRHLVEAYFALLKNQSSNVKLDLITRLSQSLKDSSIDDSMSQFYGIWKDEQTADELIDEIRQARTSNRRIEDL